MRPLLDFLAERLVRDECQRLGVSLETRRRLLAEGLTEAQADRLAVRAGVHPAVLWPAWVELGLGPLDEVHLAEGWRPAWLWNEEARAS
jgi:hypothetical protein